MTDLPIQLDPITDFLVDLLSIPSPTGYSIDAINYVKRAFEALEIPGLHLSVTPKGALMAIWPGEKSDESRGVTAHIDTLGLMVKEIKKTGRLRTTQLGKFMWNAIEFEGVTVQTYDNRHYRGTLLPNNPSTHVNNQLPEIKRVEELMEVRLDARTSSAEETRALGIEVGNFVFLDPRVEVTDTGFIRSRHLDNKSGVACLFGALLTLKTMRQKPAQDTVFLITTYEEVGHGGAGGFPDNLAELLTVDMAALGEGQTSDEFSTTICVKDSSGPYHYLMNNKLRRIAEKYHIPAKIDIYPFYGSDGSAYWRAGGQARVGLIGPGVDASHAYERTHQDSLIHTIHLIVRYLLEVE